MMFPKQLPLLAVLAFASSGSVAAAADYAFVFFEGSIAGVYDADTLDFVAAPDVGLSARQAIGVPDDSDPTQFAKIYIVNDDAVRILEPTPPFATISNVPLNTTVSSVERAGLLTPDARWLLVAAESTLFLFNAQSEASPAMQRIEMGSGQIITSLAVDPGGERAYVSIEDSKDLHVVNLQANRPQRLAGPIGLPEEPTMVTIAPNGAGIFAVEPGKLYDIDSNNGATRGDPLALDNDNFIPRFFYFDGGAPLNRMTVVHGNSISMVTLTSFTREFGAAPPFRVDKILAPTQDHLFLLNRFEKQIFEHTLGGSFDGLRDPRNQTPLGASAIDMQFDLAVRSLFVLGDETLFRFSADARSFEASISFTGSPTGLSVLSKPGAAADAIELYGGNNQIATALQNFSRPIAVRVSDSNGVPSFGATVTFSSLESNVGLDYPTTVTNRFGIATTKVLSPTAHSFSIRAEIESGEATIFNFNGGAALKGALTVLSGDFQIASGVPFPELSLPQPGPLPREIRVRIVSAGVSIPPTELTVTTNNDLVTCPSTVTTDSDGEATLQCTSEKLPIINRPDLPPIAPTSSRKTLIDIQDDSGRGMAKPIQILVAIENDLPSIFRKETQNLIRGTAGQIIEDAVELTVLSRIGRPLAEVAVEFETDNRLTPIPLIAPSDASGSIRASMQLGCRPGRGSFTASLNGPDLPEHSFEYLIVSGPASSAAVLQGNNQVGQAGELLDGPGQSLVARITDSCGNLARGVPVTWQVVPPDAATLENQSFESDQNGRISAMVRMGTRPGDFSVIASAGDRVSATFNLRIEGGMAPMAVAFTNGASFMPGWTPGSVGSIFSAGLLGGIDGVVLADAPFPTNLRNVRVLVNGAPAPIFSMANTNGQEQINIQVPFSTPAPADNIVVSVENNGLSFPFNDVQTSVVQPGIFEYTLQGDRFAAALHADYSLVEPQNPARPGEVIQLFFTGGGPLDQDVATNVTGPIPPARPTHPLSITLNSSPQESLGSFYAPQLVAVYQVNFRVAGDAPDGNLEMQITQDGIESQTALLPVRR